MSPQPVILLKLILDLFRMINIQGRELCLRDFANFAFSSGLRRDTCKPICFKIGLIHCDFKLNDLDLQSTVQGYGKAITCAVILLSSCMKQPKCS